jgi:C-5 cytosine-specific DNA methylase
MGEAKRMMPPLAIDLYCGLGGWAEGFLSEGYRVVGFDIERHDYGTGGYPGFLVLQDVLTLHGSQFKDAAVIVASPPCQAYSYRAMPWSRAKSLPPPDNTLFEACFRIQREASEAAGRYIPLIVENVRGAQKWVGRAQWHFGSYFLWGDVPALMPISFSQKFNPDRSLVRGACRSRTASTAAFDVICTSLRKPASLRRTWSSMAGNPEIKQAGSGPAWFDNGICRFSSAGLNRKLASAQIAKIPFPLSQHIARCFRPENALSLGHEGSDLRAGIDARETGKAGS